MEIERLQSKHAQAISACFHAVYGDSYANGLFYDVDELAREIRAGRLCRQREAPLHCSRPDGHGGMLLVRVA